jgi:signal transduction histidine kinase
MNKKYVSLLIIICALVTVFVLVILSRFQAVSEKIVITEKNEVYDLTKIQDLKNSVIQLAPPEIYYPNFHLSPNNFSKTIPDSIESYGKERIDYLSQRFIVLLPDDDAYILNFTLSGRHAMRVYVNEKIVGETGKIGTTKKDVEVWENNITVTASSKAGRMDIILNSAQFYHAKRGATLASLNIGKTRTELNFFNSEILKGIAVMGVFLCAAILLLGMYFLLSNTITTLYFSFACFVIALRELMQSQGWTYFNMNGNIAFMLEYLSVPLLTIFLSLYLRDYATRKFLQVMRHTALIASVIFALCVLFGDSLFYTDILKYYQIILVVSIVPEISGLFFVIKNPNNEQRAALYGIAVFYLSALYDIAMYNDIFGDIRNIPISEIAMLIFVLAQTISLFFMNNRLLVENREARQRLVTEKVALENLNRLKTEFLGNVSHELKTPLTVMSGYAQTTKIIADESDELNSNEISRRMSLISSEAERLSLMVAQILDISRIDEGRIDEGRMLMDPKHCYAEEIIHSAIQTYYPILNKNHNRLDIRIDSALPSIYADPTRISQVIVNLISNALRYTVEGVISVSAKKENSSIVICVSDTGVGIEAERLDSIFERYNKQSSSKERDTGTGLGMYICKYIIEQHGGEIRVESKVGIGTSVFFTLPVKQANSESC